MSEHKVLIKEWMKNRAEADALQKKATEPTVEIQNERFYGHLRGLQDTGKVIEVRCRHGSWPAMRYVYLKFSEWLHAGEFHLHYITGEKLVVKGRNLRPLYEHMLMEKLTYIREAAEDEKGQDHELFVDELIYLIPKEGDGSFENQDT